MTANPELLRLYKAKRRNNCLAIGALDHARRELAKGERAYSDQWPWQRGAGNVTIQPKERPLQSGRYAWIENYASAGLRKAGFADEIARRGIDHNGWFIDAFEDEVYRGIVLQFPGRKGKAQYIAGYADPYNSGAVFVDLADIIEGDGSEDDSDARRTAAHRADRIAEIHAERERDYQAVANARFRFEEIPDEIASIGERINKLRSERRAARKLSRESFPTICETLVSKIRDYVSQIQKLKAERRKLESDYSHSKHWVEA